ncbi:MAG: tRNA 2-thiouridine(34) synthase MnmA [Acetanaerobacterium sp.]
MAKRVMIGMSGGVDSSVAALLLQQQGYEVVGVTFRLFSESDLNITGESRCCSIDDVNDARMVCDAIGIAHYVFNYKELFREKIVDAFAEQYMAGATPNPCIACNRYIKFDAFLQKAQSMGFDCIATGHYARIVYEEQSERYALYRAAMQDKDQSYVLYHLTQHSLAHMLMPLGGYDKQTVRQVAQQNGLMVAQKPDSQDICFVPNGDYASFIASYTDKPEQEGVFVDVQGNVLGRHKGVSHFTIGQRKGLGISLGRPAFVVRIDAATGTVVLGDESEVFSRTLTASDVNMIDGLAVQKPFVCTAKIRYSHREASAQVFPGQSGCLRVEFDTPQRAITKGQAVVFYDGDRILGGATIA